VNKLLDLLEVEVAEMLSAQGTAEEELAGTCSVNASLPGSAPNIQHDVKLKAFWVKHFARRCRTKAKNACNGHPNCTWSQ